MTDIATVKLSAVQLAYDGIIELVVKRELRPGERTSVYLLADQLGIGRTPVREAINRLHTEGFLSVSGRSGTMVNSINVEEAHQLFAMRSCMEEFSADYAVKKITPQALETLADYIDQLRHAGTTADFVKANTAFHAAIVALAGNPTLDRFYAQLQIQLLVAIYLADRGINSAAAEARHQEHLAIFAALQKRDSAALKTAMRDHIATTQDAVLDV